MEWSRPHPTRRAVLGTLGSCLAASVAGCSGTTSRAAAEDPPSTATPTPTTAPDDEFDRETIDAAREVGLQVRESTVYMTQDGELSGTGYYYQSSDLVATAGHLYYSNSALDGWLPDGTRVSLEELGHAFRSDMDAAAARADVERPPLERGNPAALEPGQPLVGVGNAPAAGNWAITLGRFRSFDERMHNLTTTVPTTGGFSGGPTVTLDGAVVGHVSGLDRLDRERQAVYGPGAQLNATGHERIDTVDQLLGRWLDE